MKYNFLCIKDRKQSDTREAGIDWNTQPYKTAAEAALSYLGHFSTIILSTKMTTIHLPFLCLCPAQKRPKHLLQDEQFCIPYASFIPDTQFPPLFHGTRNSDQQTTHGV